MSERHGGGGAPAPETVSSPHPQALPSPPARQGKGLGGGSRRPCSEAPSRWQCAEGPTCSGTAITFSQRNWRNYSKHSSAAELKGFPSFFFTLFSASSFTGSCPGHVQPRVWPWRQVCCFEGGGHGPERQLLVWPAPQRGCPACPTALPRGRNREENAKAGWGRCQVCLQQPCGWGCNHVGLQVPQSPAGWPSGYPVFTVLGLVRPPGTFPHGEELLRQPSALSASIVAVKLSLAAGRGRCLPGPISWVAIVDLQTEGLWGVGGMRFAEEPCIGGLALLENITLLSHVSRGQEFRTSLMTLKLRCQQDWFPLEAQGENLIPVSPGFGSPRWPWCGCAPPSLLLFLRSLLLCLCVCRISLCFLLKGFP